MSIQYKQSIQFFFSIFLSKNVLPQRVMQSSLILTWLVLAAWPQCPRMIHFTTTLFVVFGVTNKKTTYKTDS